VIQQQGADRVVVQLPGVQDTVEAKKIIGATATLEYRAVDEANDSFTAAQSGRIPPESRLYTDDNGQPVLLKKRLIVSGDQLIGASSGFDQQTGQPQVSVTLDGVGAKRMLDFTRDNVGNRMAVVYIEQKPGGRKTEEVISVAVVREPFGKRFQTTGLDSMSEASQLALLLRAGALAAPMEIVEERTVGPSLGADNVAQGFKSVMIGFILVLIFMALYYRVFGLVADMALFANLVLLVAMLSMLGATLTMPGIAGIVLTAVDANVLIFERIREELRNGNTPQASIRAGYDKAFSTIADANITTLIAAFVLFLFGTGPIKGFAVTLSLGILTSMFTAIMGTRSVINLIYGGKKRVKKLAI
jgi:preprotein translocase subunit SecD